MELHKALVKRLITKSYFSRFSSPVVTLGHCQNLVPPNACKTNFHREYITSPDSSEKGFFRKFLQRREINQSTARIPEFFSLPVGDKLREKLKGINITRDHLRLEGLPPNVPESPAKDAPYGFTVQDARKVLRLYQVEKLKLKLRAIPKSSVSYREFARICVDFCENEEEGTEFAKLLDESGNVIVLGNTVFLRPEQVAKSMEALISECVANPDDPRRKQLEQMEKQKAIIDQTAKALVRRELYCGFGLLAVQTLGFMRLTFWELSWDVMEPICYFVTTLHCAFAFGFFMKTSIEPTFQGYFHRRFKAKQDKLMKLHNFDLDKYNDLRKLFYHENLPNLDRFKSSSHAEGPGGASLRYVQ